MSGRRDIARAAATTVALAAAVVVLTRAGHGPLATPPLSADRFASWVEDVGPSLAALGVVRLAALGAAWYGFAVTALALVARALRVPWLSWLARWATPAMLRHSLGVLAGVSSITVSATPATAVAGTGSEMTSVTMHAFDQPATDAPVMQRLGPATPPPTPPAPAPPAAPDTWTVEPGDHLWSVAERVLLAHGRGTTDAEIARYWARLLDANRARLADPTNVDLLFSGQDLVLPPLEDAAPLSAGGLPETA